MNKAKTILRTFVAIAVLLALLPARGEDRSMLPKQYFAATAPGSWAKYDQTSTDQKGKSTAWEITLSRLDDEDGKIWLEMRKVPKTGSSDKATTFKYLLNPDFKFEKDALNYLNFIDRAIMQEDGKKAVEMPWDMMKSMMGGGLANIDYASSVEPKGREKIGERLCDHYFLHGEFDVKVLFVRVKGAYEDDLWLNDAVPFGRVKETSVSRDQSGKSLGRTEWMLAETGSGAKSRITGQVQKMNFPGPGR